MPPGAQFFFTYLIKSYSVRVSTSETCAHHFLVQFPDEASPRDKLIVGAICCAVALPFTLVLAEMFAKACEPEFPGARTHRPPAQTLPPPYL